MKHALLLFALFFVMALPAAAAPGESAYARVMKTGTLRVGYNVWPPFITKDPKDGKMGGAPVLCRKCGRTTNTIQKYCIYCGEPVAAGHLFQKL